MSGNGYLPVIVLALFFDFNNPIFTAEMVIQDKQIVIPINTGTMNEHTESHKRNARSTGDQYYQIVSRIWGVSIQLREHMIK
jgi:subtilase family serine protease